MGIVSKVKSLLGGKKSNSPTPSQQYSSPIGPQPMSTVNNPTSTATTGKSSGQYLKEGKTQPTQQYSSPIGPSKPKRSGGGGSSQPASLFADIDLSKPAGGSLTDTNELLERQNQQRIEQERRQRLNIAARIKASQEAAIRREEERLRQADISFSQSINTSPRGSATIQPRLRTDKELQEQFVYGGPVGSTSTAAFNVLQERKAQDIQDTAQAVANNYIDSKRAELQDKVNQLGYDLQDGKISEAEFNRRRDALIKKEVDEANRKAKEYAEAESAGLDKDLKKLITKKRYVDIASTAVVSAATGYGAGLLGIGTSRAAQAVGLGLLTKESYGAVKETVQTGSPVSLLELGTSLGTGGVGYARGAITRQARIQANVVKAFDTAAIETREISRGADAVLRKLKLDNEGQRTYETLRNDGFSFVLKEVRYKPGTNSNAEQGKIINEYSPKAYIVDVVGRGGEKVKSYSVGEVYIKGSKGKLLKEDIQAQLTGIIEDKRLSGIQEVLSGEIKGNQGFIPKSKASYYVETSEVRKDKLGKVTKTDTETRMSLLDDSQTLWPESFAPTREQLNRLRNIKEGLSEKGTPIRGKTETTTYSSFGETRFSLFSDVSDRGVRLQTGRTKEEMSFSLFDTPTQGKTGGPVVMSAPPIKEVLKKPTLFDEELTLIPKDTEAERIADLPTMVGGGGKGPSLFGQPQTSGRTANKAAEESLLGPFNLGLLGEETRPSVIRLTAKANKPTGSLSKFSLLSAELPRESIRTEKAFTFDFDKELSLMNAANSSSSFELTKPIDNTGLASFELSRQGQPQASESILDLGIDTPTTPSSRTDINPRITPPRVTLFSMDEQDRQPVGKPVPGMAGFDVFGYQDATKKNKAKWVKLNKSNPLTKDSALDLGGWAVDESISARFKIVPKKGKPISLDDTSIGNFWESNSGKFRNYKVRKGNKMSLMDEFIETSGNRLDSSNEVKQIKLAKVKSGFWGSKNNSSPLKTFSLLD